MNNIFMNTKLKQFLITVLFCFSFCIIIGFIFFQGLIFEYRSPRFAFFAYGLIGAVIYSALEYGSIKESILYALALLTINIFIYKANPFNFVIRDITMITLFWLGIFIYKIRFEKKMDNFKFWRAFAFGVSTAIALCLAGLVIIPINVSFNKISFLLITRLSYLYLQSGMLIGLGLGLGYDTSNYFINQNRNLPLPDKVVNKT